MKKTLPWSARVWFNASYAILIVLGITFIARRVLIPDEHDFFLKISTFVLIIGLLAEVYLLIAFILKPKTYLKGMKTWAKYGVIFTLASILLSLILVVVSYLQAGNEWRDLVFWVALIYSPLFVALGSILGSIIGLVKEKFFSRK